MSAVIPISEPHKIPRESRNNQIAHVFKPFFISAQLAGLYYPVQCTPEGKQGWTFTRLYCAGNVCLLWLSFGRTLAIYDYSDEGFNAILFFKLVASLWVLLCAVQATAVYLSCSENFPKFEHLWNEIVQADDSSYHIKLRRNITIYMVIGWLLVCVNVLTIVYAIFMTDLLVVYMLPLTSENRYYITCQIFLSAIVIWQSTSWIFPTILLIVFTKYFIYKYQLLGQKIKNNARDNQMAASNLRLYRLEHDKVTQLVQRADDVMNPCAAGVLLCNIAIICLIMYITIWNSDANTNPVSMTANFFWIICSSICISIFVVGGHLINYRVCLYGTGLLLLYFISSLLLFTIIYVLLWHNRLRYLASDPVGMNLSSASNIEIM